MRQLIMNKDEAKLRIVEEALKQIAKHESRTRRPHATIVSVVTAAEILPIVKKLSVSTGLSLYHLDTKICEAEDLDGFTRVEDGRVFVQHPYLLPKVDEKAIVLLTGVGPNDKTNYGIVQRIIDKRGTLGYRYSHNHMVIVQLEKPSNTITDSWSCSMNNYITLDTMFSEVE